MKVIFLDIDGVLALDRQFVLTNRKKFHHKHPVAAELNVPYPFDKGAVKVFNEILSKTECYIVLSSDWKLHWTLEEIEKIFALNGVARSPIEFTPRLKDIDPAAAERCAWRCLLERARCLEIQHWLKTHPGVTHWVAIDDLNMSHDFLKDIGLDNFVHTPRSNEGIKQNGVTEKILSYL